jgi:GT2 family glycosyltransferase
MVPVAALVATCSRPALLQQRTLPSLRQQVRPPDVVVVVNDGAPHPQATQAALVDLADQGRIQLLGNRRGLGPAGAWNTGLQWLRTQGFDGFVALLDDDDTWDPEHLERNQQAASATGAAFAVSGLRLHRDGRLEPRPLLSRLVAADFLVGNPGWQGSNTFVRMSALEAVGGFDEQLPSMHDRDLAIRLLRQPGVSGVLVPEWTATWYLGTPGCLTARSDGKLNALQRFLAKHGSLMNLEERAAYFERAHRMFGFTQAEIECRSD